MSRRNSTAVRGLSFVDSFADRYEVYTFDPEVIEARKRIEADFPRLQCLWDKDRKEHVIVEHCNDGTDRLVFAIKTFHEDLIRARLHKADHNNFDPLDEIDKYNEALEKQLDDQMYEQVREAGEKLAHAFAQDGLTVRPRMAPLSVSLKRKRALPNFEAPTRTIRSR